MGSLRRWLKARLGLSASAQEPSPGSINLLEDVPVKIDAPELAGIDTTIVQKPWSVARLTAIFRDLQRNPGPASVQAGRLARHCLSSFWLTAPVDQLEALYAGGVGDLQRLQLEGSLPQQPLATDERQWRDGLVARLGQVEQSSQKLNLLLALMPYFPPHSLSVEEPLESLPRWLLRDYVIYCQPELKYVLEGPAGLIGPSGASPASAEALLEMEPLSQRRGEEAMAWFRDEEALTRMQALVNLYGMDPDDQDTIAELAVLRRVVAQLWLDVDSSQLQTLYDTPVGLLTRSLITAGFGTELVNEVDQRARRDLAPRVADLTQSKALNALLAALLFYPAGQIEVADADGIPEWLIEELRSL